MAISPSRPCDTERVYASELTLHDDAKGIQDEFHQSPPQAPAPWARKSPGRWPFTAST